MGVDAPQIDNESTIRNILQSIVEVVSRRTSEGYAYVIIGNVIKELEKKHGFLKYIELRGAQYAENIEPISVHSQINTINSKRIGEALQSFVDTIITTMGNNAGYFFIKEVKEELPRNYDRIMRNLGVDLDLMQLSYITSRKETSRKAISNSELLKQVLNAFIDILVEYQNREFAVTIMEKALDRGIREFNILKYVIIKNILYTSDAEIISVDTDVDTVDPTVIKNAIQKICLEIEGYLQCYNGPPIITKLKTYLDKDYLIKLQQIGINPDEITPEKEVILKHVLETIVNVLGELTSENQSMLMMHHLIQKTSNRYDYLKGVKIDKLRYSRGLDAVYIPQHVASISQRDIGRALQKLIENLVVDLGENKGNQFLERFKEKIGNNNLDKIQEMGVNLHLIELKQNLNF
jgi:hypothetical protein